MRMQPENPNLVGPRLRQELSEKYFIACIESPAQFSLAIASINESYGGSWNLAYRQCQCGQKKRFHQPSLAITKS